MTTLENVLLSTFEPVAEARKRTEITLSRGVGEDREDIVLVITSEQGRPVITYPNGARDIVCENTVHQEGISARPDSDLQPESSGEIGGSPTTESEGQGDSTESPTSIEGEHTPGDPAPDPVVTS